MNIRAMRAFVELVKQKSVTEAANALCVTQPTISKLVKQLEFELNLPLMIRHGHKFELTPAGQLVFDQGSSILKQMKNLNEAINEFHTQETGILKLGMPATVGSFFFNEILSTFHERYPRIQIQLIEDGSEVVAPMVLSWKLDVGVSMLPVTTELATRPFIYDDLYFISRKPSVWQQFSEVYLTDIRDAEFVLFSESFSITQRLIHGFAIRQQTLKFNERSAHWKFLVSLVEASDRCTVLPTTMANELDDRIFHKARILDVEQNWHLAMVWSNTRHISRPLRVWLELCEAMLPLVVERG